MKRYVYVLRDPRTQDIRYVGVTSDLDRRLAAHIREGQLSDKKRWLIELLDQGYIPIIEPLEVVDEDVFSKEKYWVSKLEQEGHNLLNINLTEPKAEHTRKRKRKLSTRQRSDKGKPISDVKRKVLDQKVAARDVVGIDQKAWLRISQLLEDVDSMILMNTFCESLHCTRPTAYGYFRNIVNQFPEVWEIVTVRLKGRGRPQLALRKK